MGDETSTGTTLSETASEGRATTAASGDFAFPRAPDTFVTSETMAACQQCRDSRGDVVFNGLWAS